MTTEDSSSTSTEQVGRFRSEVIERCPGLASVTWPIIPMSERLQAAEQLRERLSGMPFHAKKAARWKAETGNEMDYWLLLQGSQMTAHRR